jgi:hypothetical protein
VFLPETNEELEKHITMEHPEIFRFPIANEEIDKQLQTENHHLLLQEEQQQQHDLTLKSVVSDIVDELVIEMATMMLNSMMLDEEEEDRKELQEKSTQDDHIDDDHDNEEEQEEKATDEEKKATDEEKKQEHPKTQENEQGKATEKEKGRATEKEKGGSCFLCFKPYASNHGFNQHMKKTHKGFGEDYLALKQDVLALKRKGLEEHQERKKMQKSMENILQRTFSLEKKNLASLAETGEDSKNESNKNILLVDAGPNLKKESNKKRVVDFLNDQLTEKEIKAEDINKVRVIGRQKNILKVCNTVNIPFVCFYFNY